MSFAPLDLTGRTAVVIGATSGIGRVLAHGLAEAGADVVPTARRAELIETTAEEIERAGRRTLRVASDVTDTASLQALLDAVVSAFGKVDIMINCAGRTKRVPTLDLTDDDWHGILETNLTGTLRAAQVFGRHMAPFYLRGPHSEPFLDRIHRINRIADRGTRRLLMTAERAVSPRVAPASRRALYPDPLESA